MACVINIAIGQYFGVLILFTYSLYTNIRLTKLALDFMDRGFRVISSTDGSSDRMSIDSQPPINPCTKDRGGRHAMGTARPTCEPNILG